ncbi:MAG: aspartate/glutamate racemase family protein [Terracidiphilus sp.]
MKKGRCLGLVGGLGVGAAVHYYRSLAKAHADRGYVLDIVMAHAETERVFAYVQAGDRRGLANYLVEFIHRLKAAGAEFAAIPAVTPHYCVRELAEITPLPILNIFDPLNRELARKGAKRVGVFGTRFVIESKLFGLVENAEVCRPQPDEIESIHATYTELVRRCIGTGEQYRALTDLANKILQRDRLDAIILAGTDLALLFNETNTEFPAIDCAALHLAEIVKAMTAQSA